MRKQYHFWPGKQGLDAWDVDRLIALAADLPVIEVTLGDIWELDTAYWSTGYDGPLTVRDIASHFGLVEAADLSYPIILGFDNRVMDGMHRIVRALREGRASIAAKRFDVQPDPDFRDVRPSDLAYDDSGSADADRGAR